MAPFQRGAVLLFMDDQRKYLVQVQCQPLRREQEDNIVKELAASFPVRQCRAGQDGLDIELVASHRLAYGALKDLADLIEQTLARQGAHLKSGVISEAVVGPLAAAVSRASRALERQALFVPLLAGLLGRFAGRVSGPARLVPVMYFHWGISLDLALAGKLKQTARLEAATDF